MGGRQDYYKACLATILYAVMMAKTWTDNVNNFYYFIILLFYYN